MILIGDVRKRLAELPDRSVRCCVTSPPYWGLRDYGTEPLVWGGDTDHEHVWAGELRHVGGAGLQGVTSQRTNRSNVEAQEKVRTAGQFCACGAWLGHLGLEPTPDLYIEHLTDVFREVRRVLTDDGTLWLNIGDCYAGSGKGGNPEAGTKQGTNAGSQTVGVLYGREQVDAETERLRIREQFKAQRSAGYKPKDLIGIPWMLAFALRADGWYLRSEVIWSKPNPMPESVTDRPTKAHEQVFLLAKSARYFYDADAIREPASGQQHARNITTGAPSLEPSGGLRSPHGGLWGTSEKNGAGRNKRTVWTITPKPFKGAHFATFPPALVEPCVLAGSAVGDMVLDPFLGSGTTGVVALGHGRGVIGIELSEPYARDIAGPRITKECGVDPLIVG